MQLWWCHNLKKVPKPLLQRFRRNRRSGHKKTTAHCRCRKQNLSITFLHQRYSCVNICLTGRQRPLNLIVVETLERPTWALLYHCLFLARKLRYDHLHFPLHTSSCSSHEGTPWCNQARLNYPLLGTRTRNDEALGAGTAHHFKAVLSHQLQTPPLASLDYKGPPRPHVKDDVKK